MTPAAPKVPRAVLLRAQALHVAQVLGPLGLSGLGLLLVAVFVSTVVLPGLESAAAVRTGELAALRARLDRLQAAGGAAARAAREGADPVGAVVDQLPTAAELTRFVDAVHTLAARRGAAVARTEYRVQPSLQGRALRYQLVLPARGTYPQLRGWLDAVLAEHPTASLEELQMVRSTEGQSVLDARVTIGYYSRSARR